MPTIVDDPSAAWPTLRAISAVVAVCSSTAAAMVALSASRFVCSAIGGLLVGGRGHADVGQRRQLGADLRLGGGRVTVPGGLDLPPVAGGGQRQDPVLQCRQVRGPGLPERGRRARGVGRQREGLLGVGVLLDFASRFGQGGLGGRTAVSVRGEQIVVGGEPRAVDRARSRMPSQRARLSGPEQ
ncbi:hypothetical protein AB0J83_36805 [Actinoplanes sp. NPDC049596]|uniref:hypothetical protein n=1 Tax=unclassified Actinoplanes TaxID=2626549 RepID=UPI003439E449